MINTALYLLHTFRFPKTLPMVKYVRKVALLLSVLFILVGVPGCKKKSGGNCQKKKIKTAFNNWAAKETKAGNYWAKDSCNTDFFKKLKADVQMDHVIGIPDNINYSFSDLNGDGIMDGLVTFIPKQCNCTTENNWTQYQMLVISDKNNYSVQDTFFNTIGKELKGFYHLDSISEKKIYGSYFEFQEGDNQCCPSIERPIFISYPTRKIQFIK